MEILLLNIGSTAWQWYFVPSLLLVDLFIVISSNNPLHFKYESNNNNNRKGNITSLI